MTRIYALFIVLTLGFLSLPALASDDLFFHSTDALAARDENGKLHQSPNLNPTDWESHLSWRPLYYLQSGRSLSEQPAYVGALQTALCRLGYYCGEIDGIFSPEVSEAIARLQKNYSMHVTGTLTTPVRRALFLP